VLLSSEDPSQKSPCEILPPKAQQLLLCKQLSTQNTHIIHWRRLGPRFGGDEVGALAPKIFLPSPPKFEIGGDGGGLTVFIIHEFQYLTHGV